LRRHPKNGRVLDSILSTIGSRHKTQRVWLLLEERKSLGGEEYYYYLQVGCERHSEEERAVDYEMDHILTSTNHILGNNLCPTLRFGSGKGACPRHLRWPYDIHQRVMDTQQDHSVRWEYISRWRYISKMEISISKIIINPLYSSLMSIFYCILIGFIL